MECPVCGKVCDMEEMLFNEYLGELQCEHCFREYYEGIADAYEDMTGDNDYPWGDEW